MQTGMYHSFSERLFAIKNSLLVYSHCFWNEICSDSKNTFQESQVSDFILLLGKAGLLHWPPSGSWKYPLDTSHNPRQTSSGNLQERKADSTFKGEDKYLTVKTKTKKQRFASCSQAAAAFTLTATHREVMRPGLDPTVKSERNKQQNSWCKQLGWILRMYMQIFWVSVHAPFRSWVTRNSNVNGRICNRLLRKVKDNMLRISSTTLSVS